MIDGTKGDPCRKGSERTEANKEACRDEPAGRAPRKANIMNKAWRVMRPGCLDFPESGSSMSMDQ